MQRLLQTWLLFYIELAATGQETLSDDLTVVVNNSGPAVLDSNMTFCARIYDYMGNLVDPLSYKYVWENDVSIFERKQVTYADEYAKLDRVFTSTAVNRGKYTMRVHVFSTDFFLPATNKLNKKVASGETKFVLTETINGQLLFHQNTTVKPPRGVFATGQNITVTASVHDRFTQAKFSYWWKLNESSQIEMTTNPHLDVQFPNPGSYFLDVGVTALINFTDELGFNHTLSRKGLFSYVITLKDPVSTVTDNASISYDLGEELIVEIACTGSPPFLLSWTLLTPDGNTLAVHMRKLVCNGLIYHYMNLTGNYTLSFNVQNIVSREGRHINIHVAEREPTIPASPAYIPVICVAVALTVLAVMFYAYRRDRARNSVETADFDFHFMQDSVSVLDNVRQKVKLFATSVRLKFSTHPTQSTEIPSSETVLTSRGYGSINNNTTVDDCLYNTKDDHVRWISSSVKL